MIQVDVCTSEILTAVIKNVNLRAPSFVDSGHIAGRPHIIANLPLTARSNLSPSSNPKAAYFEAQ